MGVNENISLPELYEAKEWKKVKKSWGEKASKEFLNKTDKELERVVIDNNMHIKETTDKVKSNPAYANAVKIIKDFDDALKDRLKDTKLAIDFANKLLYERKKGSKEVIQEEKQQEE